MGSGVGLAVGVLGALAVILVVTGIFGRLARSARQPRVVGEMVAGVVLGPSILGLLLPAIRQDVFTPDVRSVLEVLSTIGLTFYMFLVGVGIDRRFLNLRSVRRSAAVAGSGIAVPLVLGAGTGLLFYAQFAGPAASPVEFALFLGSALAITAFPVLARILEERRMAGTSMGAMALVAAAIDDAGAWLLLVVIVALGAHGTVSGVLLSVGGAVAFTVGMLTVARRLLRPLARRVRRVGGMTHGTVAVVLLVVLGCAWFTDIIGIHAVFGGFVAGLAMPGSRTLRRELTTRLTDVNAVLLMPVFFVLSGFNTDLSGLFDRALVIPFLVLVGVAFAGKYLGCALAVRAHGLSWRHASAVGALMNARGTMVLIFINIGLAQGLIGQELFAILVLIAVVTTATALPMYRVSFPAWLEDIERGGTELRNGTTHPLTVSVGSGTDNRASERNEVA